MFYYYMLTIELSIDNRWTLKILNLYIFSLKFSILFVNKNFHNRTHINSLNFANFYQYFS